MHVFHGLPYLDAFSWSFSFWFQYQFPLDHKYRHWIIFGRAFFHLNVGSNVEFSWKIKANRKKQRPNCNSSLLLRYVGDEHEMQIGKIISTFLLHLLHFLHVTFQMETILRYSYRFGALVYRFKVCNMRFVRCGVGFNQIYGRKFDFNQLKSFGPIIILCEHLMRWPKWSRIM